MNCLTRVYKSLLKFWYSDDPIYFDTVTCMGNTKNKIKWVAVVPENTILCDTITKSYLGTDISKTRIWYTGQMFEKIIGDNRYKMLDKRVVSPWIWIGCGEKDYTLQLDEYLVEGNLITLDLLKRLFPKETEWTYICFKTLDSLEFPINGIQIE